MDVLKYAAMSMIANRSRTLHALIRRVRGLGLREH